jgi:ornithine cyclodeaminase/alanine dehydrogenase-like protein (mu-crystallin family)
MTGIHLNSIGSTLLDQRELDATAWPLVDRIVVDTQLALKESGDALVANTSDLRRKHAESVGARGGLGCGVGPLRLPVRGR